MYFEIEKHFQIYIEEPYTYILLFIRANNNNIIHWLSLTAALPLLALCCNGGSDLWHCKIATLHYDSDFSFFRVSEIWPNDWRATSDDLVINVALPSMTTYRNAQGKINLDYLIDARPCECLRFRHAISYLT